MCNHVFLLFLEISSCLLLMVLRAAEWSSPFPFEFEMLFLHSWGLWEAEAEGQEGTEYRPRWTEATNQAWLPSKQIHLFTSGTFLHWLVIIFTCSHWYILFCFLESHENHFLGEWESFPPFHELIKGRFTEKDLHVKVRKSLARPRRPGRFTFLTHPTLIPEITEICGRCRGWWAGWNKVF